MDTGKWKLFDEEFRAVRMRRDLIVQHFTSAGLGSTFRTYADQSMVMPEREVPGIRAMAWAHPIKTTSFERI
jgi:hypothetical protein